MRRAIRRALTAAALLILLYPALSVVLALVPGPRAQIARGEGVTIGLLPGLIHYDFLLPLTPEVRARFAFAVPAGVAVDDPTKAWLILGQGGRLSYTTTGTYRDLTWRAVWRGAVGDASVLRLDVAGPVRDDIGIRWRRIGPAQMTALIDAALSDLADPPAALPGPGLGAQDVFFVATGRSDLVRTCNAWVGSVLRAAGIDFGLWTPATWSVSIALWRFG